MVLVSMAWACVLLRTLPQTAPPVPGLFSAQTHSHTHALSLHTQVVTKSHEDDKQWVWESNVGSHQYTIKEDTSDDKMVRGTR